MKKVPIDIMSKYVILFCQNMGVGITPLKLQKLLYYIQSWHIAKFNKDTLYNDLPEAWVNGPVYREIYNSFKASFFRNQNILTNLDEISISDELKNLQVQMDLNADQLKLVDAVLATYSKFSDERLVMMSHSEKPWNEARIGLSPIERSTTKLSVDIIYNYFNKII